MSASRLPFLHVVGWLVATALTAATAAMLLDAAFHLSGLLRSLLLVGWLAFVGFLAYRIFQSPVQHFGDRLGRAWPFALFLTLMPLLFLPGTGERVRRFALPWYTPPVEVPFRVVVSSGNPVVKRGDPITLSAYLAPTRPDVALPKDAVLVIRQADHDKRLPMLGGESGGFHLVQTAVAETFAYRVEAGEGASEWHTVTAADPIAVAEGTTITIHPPRYAEGIVPPVTRPGFAEFESLQFGTAALTLKFTAPPADAYLHWKPTHPRHGGPTSFPVRLVADRLTGTADVPIPTDGTLTLVLVGEQTLRCEYPTAVRATLDAAPQFAKVAGLTNGPREARPDDRVSIELIAHDDLELVAVLVEYCVNGNEAAIRTEAVRLGGVGTKRAEGTFTFALSGKAKDGESLHLRVRVRDNRSLAEPRLSPQEAVFPPTGWAVLRLNPYAKPLAEQEVHGQRDKVRDRLTAVAALVRDAAAQVKMVQAEAPGDGSLSADQAVRLRSAREKTVDAAKQLADLAAETDLTPALRSLAGDLRGVAENQLRPAEAMIRAAEPDPTQAGRAKSLTTAATKLAETLAKLAELEARNESIARARLDQTAVRQLAEDQLALAEEPGHSPDELAKKQRDLLTRLSRAVNESDLLKGATHAALAEALRDLLDRATKLADDQAQLNAAAARTEQTARTRRTADLAKQQKDLAERAAALAERTSSAARVAGTSPADRRPFDLAAERLTSGNPLDAVSEQEKAARELDRLAEALTRAAAARTDKREAARQIARWQDDLRRRHADAAKQPLSDDLRKRFADEQTAIRTATELLRPPTADAALTKTATEARDATKAAAEGLSADTLKKAAESLAKLADQMPTAEQRAKAARSQLDQLRKEQDGIAGDAIEAIRDTRDAVGTKLDAAAKRQDTLAKTMRQLDVPGQEARREATATAAERAATDLRSGFTQDVPASQHDVRRQLDRLRQSLDGLPPADEQAGDLALLQKRLAESIPAKPTDANWAELFQLKREVANRLSKLSAPEAPSAWAEARDAALAVEQALTKANVEDLRKKAKAAAEAATRLADQLSGAESDQKRAERLARDRAEAANAAKQAAQQPPNPEASVDAARVAQRHLDELEQLRAGKAQAAKKKAAESLQKLLQTKDPDRRSGLQHDVADALRRLADEMARNGDRDTPTKLSAPRTDGDELRHLTGAGNLPNDRDADAARELAREQRKLRDAAAVAAAEVAKGVRPAETDPLGPLADEQDALATAIWTLGEKVIAQAATRSAQQLRIGSVAEALKIDVAAMLAEVPDARKLAERQTNLAKRIAAYAGQPPIEAARQAKRQDELASVTDRVLDALTKACDEQPGTADGPLGHAAAAVKMAREKMTQAARDAAANRGDGEARRQAGDLLRKAATDTATAVMGRPAPAPNASLAVGSEVRAAREQMRRAEAELRRPNGSASDPMKQAAESLLRAAKKLDPAEGGQVRQ